jgi:hypothetical protein
LAVGVDEEHLVSGSGAQPGEIGRQGGFPRPAFFPQDRDNHPLVSTTYMGIEITRYLSYSLAYIPSMAWQQATVMHKLTVSLA